MNVALLSPSPLTVQDFALRLLASSLPCFGLFLAAGGDSGGGLVFAAAGIGFPIGGWKPAERFRYA